MRLFGLFGSKKENSERENNRGSYCYFCKKSITVSEEKFYVCTTHSRSTLEEKYRYKPGSNTGSMSFLCVCLSCAQYKLEGDEFNKECPVCAQEGITGLSAAMSMGPYY